MGVSVFEFFYYYFKLVSKKLRRFILDLYCVFCLSNFYVAFLSIARIYWNFFVTKNKSRNCDHTVSPFCRKSNSHEWNRIFNVLNRCNTLVPFNHSHTGFPRQRYLWNIMFQCTNIFIFPIEKSLNFQKVRRVARKGRNNIIEKTLLNNIMIGI